MSYLNPLRLHFAGRFQAAPSTVNNDITHYNNATFKPEYQQPQQGNQPNGWWNPRGDADWRLIGCKVTTAWRANGQPVDTADPILTYLIADSDQQVAAKLVDLDPQQQLVSEVWGLEVRICDSHGNTLVRGQFDTAAFADIWDRAGSGGGDIGAAAMYQSVLSGLAWGDISQSPFLQELREHAPDGLLSIKFNVDGYNMDANSPEFTRGRIVGTIGPASAAEPRHFVLGRHFMAVAAPGGNFFSPQGKINFCVAVVNQQSGKVYLDLGNALPTTRPGGPLANLGSLSLVCEMAPNASRDFIQGMPIGNIPYRQPGWYARTAGVIELPADRRLTSEELAIIAANSLALLLPGPNSHLAPAITEPASGLYVRADDYVFRLNPDEPASASLYATQYGQPYPGARIMVVFDPSQLQGGAGQPDPATPMNALQFPSLVQADAHGIAVLPIAGHDPGNPRGYIDGQVYGLRPVFEETIAPGVNYPLNPWDFISVLLWNAFQADQPPTWYGSLQPIFQQYANLYPVMDRFLNLADYNSICAHRQLLLLAFGLDTGSPNTMPVTRDLSAAKRQAILHWLSNVGPDGQPLLGTLPPAPSALAAAAPLPPLPATEAARVSHVEGGKAAAAARRLALRSRR